MLKCFEKLIGSKTCSNNNEYKLYIEQLQLNVNHLAQLANGAQITAHEYLDNQVNEALNMTLNKVANNIDFVVKNISNVRFTNNYNQKYNGFRGVTYQPKCSTERLYVDYVLFKGNDTVDTTLRITDGSNITNIPFRAIAEESVIIEVGKKFNSSLVKLEVDNTNVRPATNYIFKNECICNSQTYGISVIGYSQCDEDLFKCQLAKLDSFAYAVLYNTGALIQESRHYGSQMNDIHINKPDELLKLADSLYARAEDYMLTAKNNFDKMIKNSCCYDCKETKVVNYKR